MAQKPSILDEQESTIADRVAARVGEINPAELREDVRELVQSTRGLQSEKEELELENEALRTNLAATEKEREKLEQRVDGGCR